MSHSLLPTLSITHASSSSLCRNPYLQRIHFHDIKRGEVVISLIFMFFLLLKDTTDARRCGSHKEGSRSSTGGLKDIKHTTEASSTKCSCEKTRATKHLSTSVTFIYEFKCWLVSARKNGFWRIFLFLFFPLFVPSCKSLGGFVERELME